MSVYCDYEYSDNFPSRRRERSLLRHRIPGRIDFATKMLPASSWTKERDDFKIGELAKCYSKETDSIATKLCYDGMQGRAISMKQPK